MAETIEGREPDFTGDTVGLETEGVKLLHRGVWAEQLKSGQELPVGGSMFNGELTTKLELDFESFDTGKFTAENLRAAYEKSEDAVTNWLDKCNSDIDPYFYFVCFNVQNKIQELLQINPDAEASAERAKAYSGEKVPKLSELKGKTECAERAALGQYLLQKAGLESAYVSGVIMADAKDSDEFPEEHSFIVVGQGDRPEETLIFDIARPHIGGIPRVLRTDVPFNYELLKGREELLVGATDVLQKQRLWFGVGEPVCGMHETLEK